MSRAPVADVAGRAGGEAKRAAVRRALRREPWRICTSVALTLAAAFRCQADSRRGRRWARDLPRDEPGVRTSSSATSTRRAGAPRGDRRRASIPSPRISAIFSGALDESRQLGAAIVVIARACSADGWITNGPTCSRSPRRLGLRRYPRALVTRAGRRRRRWACARAPAAAARSPSSRWAAARASACRGASLDAVAARGSRRARSGLSNVDGDAARARRASGRRRGRLSRRRRRLARSRARPGIGRLPWRSSRARGRPCRAPSSSQIGARRRQGGLEPVGRRRRIDAIVPAGDVEHRPSSQAAGRSARAGSHPPCDRGGRRRYPRGCRPCERPAAEHAVTQPERVAVGGRDRDERQAVDRSSADGHEQDWNAPRLKPTTADGLASRRRRQRRISALLVPAPLPDRLVQPPRVGIDRPFAGKPAARRAARSGTAPPSSTTGIAARTGPGTTPTDPQYRWNRA